MQMQMDEGVRLAEEKNRMANEQINSILKHKK